jgi:hypothetical protein
MRTAGLCVTACAAIALFVADANAAVWRWACIGQSGDQHIIINRDSLILMPKAQKITGLEKYLWRDSLDDDVKDIEDAMSFLPDDSNSGFEKTMTYKKNSDRDEKLTLTEKSSRITSKKSGRAGPRDEETIQFRKVYRFELTDEKPRNVTMQCMEYTLSTKGGRS